MRGHLKNGVQGGMRCPSLEVCKWKPWLFGLQRWGSPKHQEVPRWVPARGYGLGITSPETSWGGTGAPPSLGISARSLLPWPHFRTRDHREEDQTGRYRDRLETQQEMGVGGSEREAVDY